MSADPATITRRELSDLMLRLPELAMKTRRGDRGPDDPAVYTIAVLRPPMMVAFGDGGEIWIWNGKQWSLSPVLADAPPPPPPPAPPGALVTFWRGLRARYL